MSSNDSIRPFRADMPEESLQELRRRVVTDVLGRHAPEGLAGIHVTTLLGAIERPPSPDTQTTVPPEVANALRNGEPPPAGLSAEETIAYEASRNFAAGGSGFPAIMGTRPQTIGYSLADSPVGLAAWFYEKFAEWTDTDGEPERSRRQTCASWRPND